ncbi:MAG: mechanosensitive ion channel family protein [Candidatus Aenigmarchaeota archaeon]|nr:mechanosensitive ion channel family protein [Candidatus Aenigmarchaeota archaeon]
MDFNTFIQPLAVWLGDFSARLLPDYIIPNLRLILQLVLILVAAYIVGKLSKFLTKRLLSIVGLKRLTDKSWAEGVLRITGYKGSIVELISDLVKWLIYIVFFTFILQAVGLSEVADIFGQIAIFVPRFIGAILLIVVGFIIADFFGKVFGEAGSKLLGGHDIGQFTGGLVRYTIGLVVLIMALALVGIDIAALAILLAAVLVMVIIIAGFGLKDILPEITAGIQVKGAYKVGDRVNVNGYSGVIDEIAPTVTKLKTKGNPVILPNSVFVKNPVERIKK